MPPEPAEPAFRIDAAFHTTHWSMVLAAGSDDSVQARAALEELCRRYWYPLYAYVRRSGHEPHDAEDLTQEFLARFLEKMVQGGGVKPDGGRFRSYLLSSMKHFLVNEWQRNQTQKRGGGKLVLSLDQEQAEDRYRFEPTDVRSPDVLFDRRWALTVLDQAMHRLGREYAKDGKKDLFHLFQPLLSGDKSPHSYEQLGRTLGMSEGAVKVAVHRLRKRYGQLLRDEIAETVEKPEEIEDEIRHLILAASR